MKPWSEILLFLVLLFPAGLNAVHAGEYRKRISSLGHDFSTESDIEAEIRFGKDLSARILGNYSLLKDEKVNRYVGLVGTGISQYSGRPELKFYFAVLESSEVNAFAAPGGYIFITHGALMQMENEAQLAAVLGHEIAHVVKRHVVNSLNIRGGGATAEKGISNLIGGSSGSFREAFAHSLDEAVEILFTRGYKTEEEIEADRIGIMLASAAGYDPSALKDFLIKNRRFEAGNHQGDSEHPAYKIRMEEISKTLVANNLTNESNAKVRKRFYEIIASSGL